MKESRVTILNKSDEKLVGLETLPSAEQEKYPVVILVHGFGVTKEEGGMFDELAENLSDIGILVYRFDFSGCGESEGDYSETSLTKLEDDLSKILDFVKSQPKVDDSRIGILSQSLGTSTTVALEPKVKSIILMGSVAHPKEILTDIFGDDYNPDGVSTVVRSSGRITKVKPQFWKDFDSHNLMESIKKIHCPILFIHGGNDIKVPISEMEAYFRNTNELKEKIIIQGADHGLRPHREKMYQIVVDWFKKHL